MELITECPATRTGKAVGDTPTIDCLSIFTTTKHNTVRELIQYVAIAYAEVFGGFVGDIDIRDKIGFYYITPEDIASYIRFDGIDYESWLDHPPEGVSIHTQTDEKDGVFSCTSIIQTKKGEFTSHFKGETKRDAELIAILICCVNFKRGNLEMYATEQPPSFEDKMQGILPQKREKTIASFLATMVTAFKGESYGR